MSRSRRSVSIAVSRRSLASASLDLGRRARSRDSSSARSFSAARRDGAGRARPVSPRTSSLWRRRCSTSSACTTSTTSRWPATTLDEPVDRGESTLDRHPLTFGREPRLGVGGEAAFGLVEAPFEELLTLVQPGVAHLEVLAARRRARPPAPRARRAARRGPGRPRPRPARRPRARAAALRARRCAARSRSMLAGESAIERSRSRARLRPRGARPAPGPAPRIAA